jgi:hypothetical protein
MNTRDALVRAGKMISTDKVNQVLRHVLITPQQGDQRGTVVSGDGEVWTELTLDDQPDVTECVVSADQMRRMLTDAKDVLKIDWASGSGNVRFTVLTKASTQAQAEFQVLPRSEYPAPKPVPKNLDFHEDELGDLMPMVVHAAGGDNPLMKQLGYVLANQHGLAATDQHRIALLQFPSTWDGLLSPRLFENWPKGAPVAVHVHVHVDVRSVYIRLGEDEVRRGNYAHSDAYPDPWKRSSALNPYRGARLIVATKGLATAAKQASDVSQGMEICLKFRKDGVHVESVSEDEAQTYRSHINGRGGQRDTDVLVDGKMLVQALKALKTPTVLVGYRRYFDPIRVESGRYVECLWPAVNKNVA